MGNLMSKHCSFPKEPIPKWTKLKDFDLIAHFDRELETRTGLTIREWDAYNSAKRRIDPVAYQKEKEAIHKKIDMRNAKERLSIEDLEQIIAEKKKK